MRDRHAGVGGDSSNGVIIVQPLHVETPTLLSNQESMKTIVCNI